MKIGEFAKKELKDIATDKVFIISVLLQFTIISALLFLFTFYSTINNTNFPVTVELDKYDADLVGRLTESGVTVKVRGEDGFEIYNSQIRPTGRVGSVTIAFNSSNNEVSSDVSNIFSGYAISKVRDASEEVSFEQALEEKQFDYEFSGVKEGNYAFLPLSYGIIIPIAIILPAFIVMGFTLQGILVERKTKVIELLLVSPVSDFQIAQIKVIPYILVSAFLSLLWILYISATIQILNPLALVFVAALFSVMTVSISTIISATASSVKEANAFSSLIGMSIPMLGILPYNSLSNYFPTVIMGRVASNALTFDILFSIGVMTLISLLLFALAVYSIRRMRINFA